MLHKRIVLRSYHFLFLIIIFSCKENSKKGNQTQEFEEQKEEVSYESFNASPVDVKKLVLDDNFSVTSSMIDIRYKKEPLCKLENYHLFRTYYIIHKRSKKDFKHSKSKLCVYVADDKDKWLRNKAKENFYSINVNDSSVKLWSRFYVGQTKNQVLEIIKNQEYHTDFGVINLYSSIYQANFYFNESGIINQISIKRICKES